MKHRVVSLGIQNGHSVIITKNFIFLFLTQRHKKIITILRSQISLIWTYEYCKNTLFFNLCRSTNIGTISFSAICLVFLFLQVNSNTKDIDWPSKFSWNVNKFTHLLVSCPCESRATKHSQGTWMKLCYIVCYISELKLFACWKVFLAFLSSAVYFQNQL